MAFLRRELDTAPPTLGQSHRRKELYRRRSLQCSEAGTTAYRSRAIHDAWSTLRCCHCAGRSRMHTATNRGGYRAPQLEDDPILHRRRRPKEAATRAIGARSGTIKNEKEGDKWQRPLGILWKIAISDNGALPGSFGAGPDQRARQRRPRRASKTLSVHCTKTDLLEQKIRSVFLPTTIRMWWLLCTALIL